MTTGSDEPNIAPVNAGDVLAGKYAVERVLGSGGMGVVVAAKHIHLGERVAIKFLLQHALKNKEVVERFLREGRAAVRIKSEHVARVFDVGKLDDGAPYMVMEFLEGADLSTTLKTKGAVPVDLAVEYVLQACEAIAEAHSLGIIHRDLKPANLFVAKRADGSPVVKVIDFGISKVADPTTGTDVEMTKTDVMMGSPVYMAPEQMLSARDVDVRADVWSLGVILHYLVMGVQPFKGNSVTQLYASILEGPPHLRIERPDIPVELERAIRKCLQANPKDRWANVAELALAIADFGPPQGRVSVDRVARTLGVAPALRSTPPPPANTGGSVTPPALAATALRDGAEASTGPHTDGSWGHTKGPIARRKSRTAILVAAGLLVAVGSAAGVVALLSGGGSGAASSGAGPDVSSSTPGSGVTVTPSIASAVTTVTPASPDGPVVIAPTASASASASASHGAGTAPVPSVSVAVTAASAKPPLTGTLPPPRPPVTARPPGTPAKPPVDPFSDPH